MQVGDESVDDVDVLPQETETYLYLGFIVTEPTRPRCAGEQTAGPSRSRGGVRYQVAEAAMRGIQRFKRQLGIAAAGTGGVVTEPVS